MGPRGAKRIIKGVNREGEVTGIGRGRPPAVKRKTGQQNKRIRDSDSEEESRMDAQESQRTCRK